MSIELMRFDPATGAEKPYPSHGEQYRIYHGPVARPKPRGVGMRIRLGGGRK